MFYPISHLKKSFEPAKTSLKILTTLPPFEVSFFRDTVKKFSWKMSSTQQSYIGLKKKESRKYDHKQVSQEAVKKVIDNSKTTLLCITSSTKSELQL